jgi:hypothetical protein
MIRKETKQRTRDFLNEVKKDLPNINKGGWDIGAVNARHSVSTSRFNAAVKLGYFQKVGQNGHNAIYRCSVPYFTLEMATEVIRKEYDDRKPKHRKASPIVARPGSPMYAITPLNDVAQAILKDAKGNFVVWASKVKEAKGRVYFPAR